MAIHSFFFRLRMTTLVEPCFILIFLAMWRNTLMCGMNRTANPEYQLTKQLRYVNSSGFFSCFHVLFCCISQLKQKYDRRFLDELHQLVGFPHIRSLLEEYEVKTVTHRDRYKGATGKLSLSYVFLDPNIRESCIPT